MNERNSGIETKNIEAGKGGRGRCILHIFVCLLVTAVKAVNSL